MTRAFLPTSPHFIVYSNIEPLLLNMGVKSRWMNVGFWTDADGPDDKTEDEEEGFEYARAGKRLAQRVAEGIELAKESRFA